MIGLIIFLVVLAGFLIWSRFSIWKVKPEERAIRVISGAPRDIHGPGFCFVPKWFGCRLIRVPSKQFKVSVSAIQTYSKETPGCARESLLISIVFYLNFPRGAGLIQVQQAGVPTKEEDLLAYFGPLIRDAARQVFSKYTWKEMLGSTDLARVEIEGLINPSVPPGTIISDFIGWGGTFRFSIEDVGLPNSLKAALSYVSQAQITSQTAPDIAQRRVDLSFGAVLERMSRATGMTVKNLQKEIKTDPKLKKQFQNLSIEIAGKEGVVDGQFFDGQKITSVHVQGPEKSLSGLANVLRTSTGQGGPGGKRTKKVMMAGQEVNVEEE